MRNTEGVPKYRRLLYGAFVSSRECVRVRQFIDFALSRGLTTPGEAEILRNWVERVDMAAPHIAAPVEPVPEGKRLPGVRMKGPTKKERERSEREAARKREVEAWFGPRQPLPGEVEKLRDYEPNVDQ